MESIGNNALKMACLQVEPGHEFDVVAALTTVCENEKDYRHLILKGFGYYDVILLYESPDFGPYLTDKGSIEYILNSNVFNCYPYLGCLSDSMFDGLEKSVFVGVSLLKLHPLSSTTVHEDEAKLAYQLKLKMPGKWFALGTLGWHELVLLIHSDNFRDVAETLLHLNYEKLNADDTPGSHDALSRSLLKSFSTVCVNHKKLPEISSGKTKSLDVIEKELSRYDGLQNQIGKKAFPSISISSQPAFYPDIKEYWPDGLFSVMDTIGRHDITVTPTVEMTWATFLAYLLHFRFEFRDRIHATHTTLCMYNCVNEGDDIRNSESQILCNRKKKSEESNLKPSSFPKVQVNVDIEQFKKLFGNTNGRKLAKYMFSLNAALRNPTSCHVFWDMAQYPDLLLKIASRLKERDTYGEETPAELFLNAAHSISRGAAMRHYGIYGSQEGLPGDLAFEGGGIQRALLALEYIPTSIFDRLKSNWYGFVIAEDPKFAHYNAIIAVPFDNLWRPEAWWQIYHEIGHSIEFRYEWLRDSEPNANPVVVQFLRDMPEPLRNEYRNLLGEFVAEVFGFLLGFFGDIDLFIKTLWQLINSLSVLPRMMDFLDKYILRSFFVEMFYYEFQLEQRGSEEYNNPISVRKFLLDHLDKIEESGFEIGSNYQKEYKASYLAPTIVSLNSIASDLNMKIKRLETEKDFSFSPQRPKNNNEVPEPLAEILAGRVWPHGVENPEYLLYRLLKIASKDGPLSFPSRIAAVLTFWNASVLYLKHEMLRSSSM